MLQKLWLHQTDKLLLMKKITRQTDSYTCPECLVRVFIFLKHPVLTLIQQCTCISEHVSCGETGKKDIADLRVTHYAVYHKCIGRRSKDLEKLFGYSLFYIKLATPDSLYHVFIPPSLQFILPHSRGSSHGQTRIIRKAYDHDFYTRMMEDNYELWAQLERESGVKLFR